MKKELGLLEITEYKPSDKKAKPDGKLVYCNGCNYDITGEMSPEEAQEYLKIQNAYNILQMRRTVKFFVTLSAVGIFAGIVIGIIMLV